MWYIAESLYLILSFGRNKCLEKLLLALLLVVSTPFIGFPYILPYELSIEEGEGGLV